MKKLNIIIALLFAFTFNIINAQVPKEFNDVYVKGYLEVDDSTLVSGKFIFNDSVVSFMMSDTLVNTAWVNTLVATIDSVSFAYTSNMADSGRAEFFLPLADSIRFYDPSNGYDSYIYVDDNYTIHFEEGDGGGYWYSLNVNSIKFDNKTVSIRGSNDTIASSSHDFYATDDLFVKSIGGFNYILEVRGDELIVEVNGNTFLNGDLRMATGSTVNAISSTGTTLATEEVIDTKTSKLPLNLGSWGYGLTLSAPPAVGTFEFNNGNPQLATKLYISDTNYLGEYREMLLDNRIVAGSYIFLNNYINELHDVWVSLDVTGVTQQTGYIELDITNVTRSSTVSAGIYNISANSVVTPGDYLTAAETRSEISDSIAASPTIFTGGTFSSNSTLNGNSVDLDIGTFPSPLNSFEVITPTSTIGNGTGTQVSVTSGLVSLYHGGLVGFQASATDAQIANTSKNLTLSSSLLSTNADFDVTGNVGVDGDMNLFSSADTAYFYDKTANTHRWGGSTETSGAKGFEFYGDGNAAFQINNEWNASLEVSSGFASGGTIKLVAGNDNAGISYNSSTRVIDFNGASAHRTFSNPGYGFTEFNPDQINADFSFYGDTKLSLKMDAGLDQWNMRSELLFGDPTISSGGGLGNINIISNTNGSAGTLYQYNFGSLGGTTGWNYYRRANGSYDSPTVHPSFGQIWKHKYQGYDGSTWRTGVEIQVNASGTYSSTNTASNYRILTGESGSTTLYERLGLETGKIRFNGDNQNYDFTIESTNGGIDAYDYDAGTTVHTFNGSSFVFNGSLEVNSNILNPTGNVRVFDDADIVGSLDVTNDVTMNGQVFGSSSMTGNRYEYALTYDPISKEISAAEIVHFYGYFQDSVIAANLVDGVWQQVTNSSDSLFIVTEQVGITYLLGDTFQITSTDCHLEFNPELDFYGDISENFEMEMYNVTQGESVPKRKYQEGSGALDRAPFPGGVCYCTNCNLNDKLIMRWRNVDGGDPNANILSGSIFIRITHAK